MLKIENSDEYYDEKLLGSGRIIKEYFNELTNEIFKQNYNYAKAYNEYTGVNGELPLLYKERNMYSIISS